MKLEVELFKMNLESVEGLVNYSDKLTKTSFNQIKKNIPSYQKKISFNYYLIFLMYLL